MFSSFLGVLCAISLAMSAPPLPVTDLQIQVVDSALVQMNWSPVSLDGAGQPLIAALYELHGSSDPWFVPNDETRIATVPETTITLQLTDVQVCYRIVVVDEPQDVVRIPDGRFEMGQVGVAEPVHFVSLTNEYLLGRTEVTTSQYLAALNWANSQGMVAIHDDFVWCSDYPLIQINRDCQSNSCDYFTIRYDYDANMFFMHAATYNCGGGCADVAYPDGYDPANHPMINVTWYGAAFYCDWLSLMMGLMPYYDCDFNAIPFLNNPYSARGYRLPTEAEWEFASRYPDGRIYPHGSTDPGCDEANFLNETIGHCIYWTAQVGMYESGSAYLGLLDMSGNVMEHVNDGYELYTQEELVNPVGNNVGNQHVLRGGGWNSMKQDLNCSSRFVLPPWMTSMHAGFRICRVVH